MMDYELYQDSVVPVFYHVPKNAGTFAISTIFLYFRKWRKSTNWISDGTVETGRNIIIMSGTNQVARVIGGDPNQFCNNSKEFFKGDLPKEDQTAYYIKLEDVNSELFSNINVFSIIIESTGFEIHDDILGRFQKSFSFKKFIILRDALERAKSFFKYMTSDKAKHEPGYGSIPTGISISEFLNHASSGHLYEDSWVIRQFSNLKIGKKIRWYHYRKTKNILNEFDLCDISKCNEFLTQFYKKHKNLEISEEELGKWQEDVAYNKREETEDDYIEFDILDKFNEVTHWDRLLYRSVLGRKKIIFNDGN